MSERDVFYYASFCPFCGPEGEVAFWRCGDGKTLVLMCEECNATWLHPISIAKETALDPCSPEFTVEGLGCSLAGPNAGFATREEIRSAGWEDFIVGEIELSYYHKRNA